VSNPILVGVTGGIGSGKSTVCKIFESLGVKTYYADDRAKQLMAEDHELIEGITSLFGENAYNKNGINREEIARRAFQDKGLLEQLNQLVHPAVKKDFLQWIQDNNSSRILLKEAALLVETGSYKDLDKLIVVTASDEVRIERTLKRDTHRTKEDIQKIISKQLPESEKIEKADFIIDNGGEESLIKQVMKIYSALTI
jgi:dephospho-CoA kinase